MYLQQFLGGPLGFAQIPPIQQPGMMMGQNGQMQQGSMLDMLRINIPEEKPLHWLEDGYTGGHPFGR